jgi:hypothetical protein
MATRDEVRGFVRDDYDEDGYRVVAEQEGDGEDGDGQAGKDEDMNMEGRWILV